MDTHLPPEVQAAQSAVSSAAPSSELTVGAEVIYGLHGKCTITAIESRTIGGIESPFFRLEVVRSPLSRSVRQSPAIWVPFNAVTRGLLRMQASREQADAAMALLLNREYYLPIQADWRTSASPQLEKMIEREGLSGLAKSFSYLFCLRKKFHTLQPEQQKMMDSVQRALLRELSEILQLTPRDLEDQISKGMRGKTSFDQ